jgi:uncharacterized membrane protein
MSGDAGLRGGSMSVRVERLPSRHPALVRHAQERDESLQNRIADLITQFAGSMPFVYVHVVWFSLWVGLRVEKFPFGLLTMLVSLEAIFLATFVMISQNRADEKRQALADHQWDLVQEEEAQNERLLTLSKEILDLTRAIHGMTVGAPRGRRRGRATSPRRASG